MGCYVDYSKKYVYLQYKKKRPPHSVIPYGERVIFSAGRNGMWCKYGENQPKIQLPA